MIKKMLLAGIVGLSITHAAEVVSVNNDGEFGNRPSYNPKLSFDGSLVAFIISANSNMPGEINPENQSVFTRDRITERTNFVDLHLPHTETHRRFSISNLEMDYNNRIWLMAGTANYTNEPSKKYVVSSDGHLFKNAHMTSFKVSGDGNIFATRGRPNDYAEVIPPVPDGMCGWSWHSAKNFRSHTWFYDNVPNAGFTQESVPYDTGKTCTIHGEVRPMVLVGKSKAFASSDGSVRGFISNDRYIGSLGEYDTRRFVSYRAFLWHGRGNHEEIFGPIPGAIHTDIRNISISGDGSTVALRRYTRYPKTGGGYRYEAKIHIIDLNAGSNKEVTIPDNIMDNAWSHTELSLSHDGQYLLFNASATRYYTHGPKKGQKIKHNFNGSDLFVYDTRNDRYHLIKNKNDKHTRISDFAISGDGSTIAFSSRDKDMIDAPYQLSGYLYQQIMVMDNPLF